MTEIIESITPSLVNSVFMSIIVASAFVFGTIVAICVKYPSRIKGDFAALAGGIFFAAIAFSLIEESIKQANAVTMIIGFILGASIYSVTNHLVRKSSKYRVQSNSNNKRIYQDENDKSNKPDPSQSKNVIIGTILDSVPETLFVGVIVAMHIPGLIGAVIALFLGNLMATLNGAKIMVEQGKTKLRISMQWLGDFAIVSISGPIGYYLVKPLSGEHLSIIIGFAAGTLLIFISRELIPQAYKEDSGYMVDISLVSGFLLGFILFHFL